MAGNAGPSGRAGETLMPVARAAAHPGRDETRRAEDCWTPRDVPSALQGCEMLSLSEGMLSVWEHGGGERFQC